MKLIFRLIIHSMHLEDTEFVDDSSPFKRRMELACRNRPSTGHFMSAEEESEMNWSLVYTH